MRNLTIHLLSLVAAWESEPDGIFHEFAQAIHRAEAEAEVHAVAILRRAMGEDWRPALAYLERRYPGRWRRHTSTELTGKDGGPIQTAGRPAIDLSLLSDEELVSSARSSCDKCGTMSHGTNWTSQDGVGVDRRGA